MLPEPGADPVEIDVAAWVVRDDVDVLESVHKPSRVEPNRCTCHRPLDCGYARAAEEALAIRAEQEAQAAAEAAAKRKRRGRK